MPKHVTMYKVILPKTCSQCSFFTVLNVIGGQCLYAGHSFGNLVISPNGFQSSISSLHYRGMCYACSLKFISSATPVNLLTASIKE